MSIYETPERPQRSYREQLTIARKQQQVVRVPPWLPGDHILIGPGAQPDLRGKVRQVRSLTGHRGPRRFEFRVSLMDGRTVDEKHVVRLATAEEVAAAERRAQL